MLKHLTQTWREKEQESKCVRVCVNGWGGGENWGQSQR